MTIFTYPDFNTFFNHKKTFSVTLFFLFLTYITILLFELDAIKLVNEDEIWYFIVGENLFQNGNMIDHNNSNAFFSLQNISLGFIGNFIGKKLFYFRLFSVLVGVLTFLIYLKSTQLLLKLWEIKNEKLFILISVLVFVSQSLNIMIFRLARPEALSALFLHLMFLFFLKNLYNFEQLKSNIYNTFFISFFIFLAVFTHLNNTVPALVLVLTLLIVIFFKYKQIKYFYMLSFFLFFFASLYVLLLYLLKNVSLLEYFEIISKRVSLSNNNSNLSLLNTIKFFNKYNYNFLRSPIWITEIFSVLLLFYCYKKKSYLSYIWLISPFVILILSLIFFNQFSIRHFTVFYMYLYFPISFFIYKTLLKPKYLRLGLVLMFLCNSFAITFMFFYQDKSKSSFKLVENKFEKLQEDFNGKIIAGNLTQLHLIDNYQEFYSLSHLHRKNEDIHSIVKKIDVFILNDWDKKSVPHHSIVINDILLELKVNNINYTTDTTFIPNYGNTYIVKVIK
jgi:hypothetical protein